MFFFFSFCNLSEYGNIIRTEYIKYPNVYSISQVFLQQTI